jgi:hypothetical protein
VVWSLHVAGLPTSERSGALLGALVLGLGLAGCEGRSLFPGDEGIDFGDGDGDGDPGDGDGDDPGDGDSGDGDGDGDTPLACFPIVENLVITGDTAPASVACVEQVLGDLTIGPTTELVNLQLLSSCARSGAPRTSSATSR